MTRKEKQDLMFPGGLLAIAIALGQITLLDRNLWNFLGFYVIAAVWWRIYCRWMYDRDIFKKGDVTISIHPSDDHKSRKIFLEDDWEEVL